jgi:hypothetical protein
MHPLAFGQPNQMTEPATDRRGPRPIGLGDDTLARVSGGKGSGEREADTVPG